MGIRRHINTYRIKQSMPTILTITSCIGVIATGVLSARAMYKYMESEKEMKDDVTEAIKVAILPSAVGAGTIASFIFARKADKAVIAGLSASVASLSAQLHNINSEIRDAYSDNKELLNEKIRSCEDDPEVIVVDPDGELYMEETTKAFIRIRPSALQEAKYKLNRNYQLRCVAS